VPEKRLVSCEFFNLEDVRLPAGIDESIEYVRPVIWIVLEGHAEIRTDDLSEPTTLKRGETVLLPAVMKHPRLKTLTACHWLEVSFP